MTTITVTPTVQSVTVTAPNTVTVTRDSGGSAVTVTGGAATASATQFTPTGGAVSDVQTTLVRVIDERLSAKDSRYGALGDDSNDDGAELTAWLAALASAPYGGEGFLPPGRYRFTSSLAVAASDITISGAGREASVLNYRGTSDHALTFGNASYDPFGADTTNYRGLLLRDLGFDGTGSTSSTGAVKVIGATRWAIERLRIRQFGASGAYGIGLVDYSWVGSIEDCRIEDCYYGVKATVGSLNSANQSANAIHIRGGEIGAGCDFGIVIGDPTQTAEANPVVGSAVRIEGCAIEGTDSWGLWIIEGNGHSVDGCYFENNGPDVTPATGHIKLGNANVRPRSVNISDSWFTGAVGNGGVGIQLERVEGARIVGNSFGHFAGTGTCKGIVAGSGSAEKLHIADNYISNSVDTPYDLSASDSYFLERRDIAGTIRSFQSRRLSTPNAPFSWDVVNATGDDWMTEFKSAGARVAGIKAQGEYESAVAGKGIIVASPNGTRYRLGVDNTGTVVATAL